MLTIEVGAIGRQEEDPSTFGPDHLLGPLAFVEGDVVENDDVAWRERWSPLGFDPRLEDAAVHRCIDDPWRGQSVTAQACGEGLGFPRTERR